MRSFDTFTIATLQARLECIIVLLKAGKGEAARLLWKICPYSAEEVKQYAITDIGEEIEKEREYLEEEYT